MDLTKQMFIPKVMLQNHFDLDWRLNQIKTGFYRECQILLENNVKENQTVNIDR